MALCPLTVHCTPYLADHVTYVPYHNLSRLSLLLLERTWNSSVDKLFHVQDPPFGIRFHAFSCSGPSLWNTFPRFFMFRTLPLEHVSTLFHVQDSPFGTRFHAFSCSGLSLWNTFPRFFMFRTLPLEHVSTTAEIMCFWTF